MELIAAFVLLKLFYFEVRISVGDLVLSLVDLQTTFDAVSVPKCFSLQFILYSIGSPFSQFKFMRLLFKRLVWVIVS
jgi:hypothetical protein